MVIVAKTWTAHDHLRGLLVLQANARSFGAPGFSGPLTPGLRRAGIGSDRKAFLRDAAQLLPGKCQPWGHEKKNKSKVHPIQRPRCANRVTASPRLT
ncbi:MAG: hypothetical protein R3E00_04435 [Paracoccaceae bacterium]